MIQMNGSGSRMRTTVICMTLSWLFVAIGTTLATTGAITNKRERVPRPRVFNVVDYGAIGNDEKDNTEAFSACLKAVIEAGGGRMYLPDGVYRGRILIPPVSKPTPSWITVEIMGRANRRRSSARSAISPCKTTARSSRAWPPKVPPSSQP
jgi:hypothetical protein